MFGNYKIAPHNEQGNQRRYLRRNCKYNQILIKSATKQFRGAPDLTQVVLSVTNTMAYTITNIIRSLFMTGAVEIRLYFVIEFCLSSQRQWLQLQWIDWYIVVEPYDPKGRRPMGVGVSGASTEIPLKSGPLPNGTILIKACNNQRLPRSYLTSLLTIPYLTSPITIPIVLYLPHLLP